jgi:broad specificity phosphatase PhoE
MKTLYLIRHGQSVANAGEITHDPALIALTDAGRQQARALAAAWPQRRPAAIITSHYERAKDTAQPLCERFARAAVQTPLLHESVTLSPAAVAGSSGAARKPLVDAYWEAADPDARDGADAESFTEFSARVSAFRHTLDALADDTVIVGHGMWFALLIWQLQGFGWADSEHMRAFRRYQLALPMPNCGVYALRSQGEGAWAIRFDEALHRLLRHGDAQSDMRAAVMAGT